MNNYIVTKTEIIQTKYLVRASSLINAENRIREKNRDYGSISTIISENKSERFSSKKEIE